MVERTPKGAQTAAAMAQLRAKGQSTGTPPFGQEIGPDGLLRPSLIEANVISLVLSLSAEGLPTRAIAAELTARGYASRRGHPFNHTQIVRILAKARQP